MSCRGKEMKRDDAHRNPSIYFAIRKHMLHDGDSVKIRIRPSAALKYVLRLATARLEAAWVATIPTSDTGNYFIFYGPSQPIRELDSPFIWPHARGAVDRGDACGASVEVGPLNDDTRD
ncbi:hypothetical protein PAXRUDRAFT_610243 [Paxillus rubicundulus Ve08.2h10]|uniref:Uncharacterized protein n=1 Tax=Paxillus rubicundulus Ve08.2h10 TaxID=930991 RepID=A0A0D0DVN4_9AGAM|nr:hypothetical protein PAXRUDRAFT_610243 [Paxillus rubicundulus Ve08.2h10]